jgi:hypothetical protein
MPDDHIAVKIDGVLYVKLDDAKKLRAELDRVARERDEAWVIEAEKDETIRYLLAVRNKAEAEIDRLRGALQGLLDVQNGAPLIRDQREYEAAVETAHAALDRKRPEAT